MTTPQRRGCKDMPVCVAYHTPGTLAEEEAERLRRSLDLHRLEHYLEAVPDQGSWLANTGYKPRFVAECLDRLPKRAVLSLDADTVVERHPDLFDDYRKRTGCDLAVHSAGQAVPPERVISDVLYLANTPLQWA